MNPDFLSDLRDLVSLIWQYQPILIVLVIGGVILFALTVIDTHRHRKKQKGRHKRMH